MPDKAIDVIDEAGAAQHLVAESKRRKTIGTKEIENVVAKIARIPAKNVSKDDAEVLRDLEKSLKRVVFQSLRANVFFNSATFFAMLVMRMMRAKLKKRLISKYGSNKLKTMLKKSMAQAAW